MKERKKRFHFFFNEKGSRPHNAQEYETSCNLRGIDLRMGEPDLGRIRKARSGSSSCCEIIEANWNKKQKTSAA